MGPESAYSRNFVEGQGSRISLWVLTFTYQRQLPGGMSLLKQAVSGNGSACYLLCKMDLSFNIFTEYCGRIYQKSRNTMGQAHRPPWVVAYTGY